MNKAVKGTFGYLKKKRIQVFLWTLLCFAIALSLLLTGIITTGSKKNLLTIVAVLGCLPASKSLVSLIMYCRAQGCSIAVKEAVEKTLGSLTGMYDMYFTSYKKNFPVSHMVVEGKTICGYTEITGCDVKACEAHLTTMLKQGGHKDMTVKIFTDINKYLERLKQLNAVSHEKAPEQNDAVRTILYEISL